MKRSNIPRASAHVFAGCGGDLAGLKRAGWGPHFAVEVNTHRCRTLRHNHPEVKVFEGPIQRLLLSDYPAEQAPLYFLTFPCDHYTLAANIHQTWTGDALYLEALREIVLHYPECVVIENVYGFKKFKRVMQTFQCLPLYYCTEFLVEGAEFTFQRKKRVFLFLHRQPFQFAPIEQYLPARSDKQRLCDYLDRDAPVPPIPAYIYRRLDGHYRDRPRIYHPDHHDAVNLFTNYGRDRSLFLVEDPRCPRGVRPFSIREVARLHGFDPSYQFFGPVGQAYDMIVDSVMPPVAHAIGLAANDYFQSIPHLAQVPYPLGYREVRSERRKREEQAEALEMVRENDLPSPHTTAQLSLW